MSMQMIDVRRTGRPGTLAAAAGALLLAATLAPTPVLAANLNGLTVTGVASDDSGTETPIATYRWLVEKDKTYHVQTLSGGATVSF